MNKFLIAVSLILIAGFSVGCGNTTNTPNVDTKVNEETKNATTDYIVTTVIPTKANEGLKDSAEPGYIPINPSYDFNNVPKESGKIVWFKSGLGAKVPAISEGKLLEVINTDTQFVAYIANIEGKNFGEYISNFSENGYQIIRYQDGTATVFNNKMAINLRYNQEPGGVSTIRARILEKDEYAKLEAIAQKELQANAPKNEEVPQQAEVKPQADDKTAPTTAPQPAPVKQDKK